MADSKISALTAATSALGADELPINEAGTSKKLTVRLLLAAEQGAAFPTGAALTAFGNNRPFWRTDLGESCYYDGTRWLSSAVHYVPLGGSYIQAVADNSTYAANTGPSATAEMTALPVAGVVAVNLVLEVTDDASGTTNYVMFFDYTSATYAVIAYCPAAGYSASSSGIVATGGANNRKIIFQVVRGNGTITVHARVNGYWAHVITT